MESQRRTPTAPRSGSCLPGLPLVFYILIVINLQLYCSHCPLNPPIGGIICLYTLYSEGRGVAYSGVQLVIKRGCR